jgi:amino acid adenylation domain-containing protein
MKVIENNHDSEVISIDINQRIKERNYWFNKLSGDWSKTSFPFDHRKAGKNKPGLKSIPFAFSHELYEKLMRLSNNSDIRLYLILMTVLVLLLEKYTGNRDIIVGAPIYRQDVEGDFINKIVVLRTQLKENMSFKELLLQVSQTNFEAVEHINYSLETIPYELNMSFPQNEFPLFDVAILLENLHEKNYIRHLDLGVIFSFTRKDHCIEGVVEYKDSLYSQETARRMIFHFNNLTDRALTDIDAKIDHLSIMSDEEIKQLVVDINTTRVTRPGYPVGKMIHELFREQVERTPLHIALQWRENLLTYKELDDTANRLSRRLKNSGIQTETIVTILLEHSPELIAAVLAVLKAGGTYLPIDPEYFISRIDFLLEDSNTNHLISRKKLANKVKFTGTVIHPENLERCQNIHHDNRHDDKPAASNHALQQDTLAYVIYTSGSTGKPKGVMIPHSALVNYVWWAAQTYVRGEKLNFPLYSSISFDLTVTSIFTPLITGNTIIIYEDKEKNFMVEKIVDENNVGVIKLTPSHLYVLKYKDLQHSKIKCFIVGGELFETRIAREIASKFTGNVEIYNEYGPTEATVGCLIYKFDPGKDKSPGVPIGVPIYETQVYILDRHYKPVPVGVSGEIYVAGKGVARGYLNSPELTAEKFCLRRPGGSFYKNRPLDPRKNFLLEASDRDHMQSCSHASVSLSSHHSLHYPFTPLPHYPIYRTGDLARWLPDRNIEFLGRMDHQVKIRGYRIELAEIEQQLLRHEAVKETVVIARDAEEKSTYSEKQDQYLCAYFVSEGELPASVCREYLLNYLPDYMVPLFFVPVDNIPLTSNGKVNQKALPIPEIKKETNYMAPRDEREKKLVDIWAKVLRIDRDVISINASFFQLGGQSLKQVDLISQVQKEFNVKVSLAEIFKRQTIQELSLYIAEKEEDEHDEYISIKPAEKKEYYPLSSSQRRMYVISQLDPENAIYNVSRLVPFNQAVDAERLERTFQRLIDRHESLRSSFFILADSPVQKINKNVDLKIEYHDLEGKCELNTPSSDPQLKTIIRQFIRPFDFSRAPLLRTGLIKIHPREAILMFDIHHIINDGVSMDIMIRELTGLYREESLPQLRIQYKDYVQWENSEKNKEKLKLQEDYWVKEFEEDIPVLNLPTDYPRPVVQSFEGSSVKFEIHKQETTALNQLAMEKGVTLYMVLMAALNILSSKLSGQEDIVIGTPVAGRRHADLDKIIGLFINTLVLRNYPRGEQKITEFLHDIKIKILGAFENQEYKFEDLLEKVPVKRNVSRNPMFDVMFSWLTISRNAEIESTLEMSNERSLYSYNRQLAKFDMLFHGLEHNGKVFFSIEYCTKLFKEETILRFVQYFKRIISIIVTAPARKISQIEILSEEEKKRMLYDFNDTEREYPGHKVIHRLFTGQVERTPDGIALAAAHQLHETSITYSQLNRKADQLAGILKEKGVLADAIVGIMIERSIEMFIGILGILKAGGAYLPLAPDYPEDRIVYMLTDSGARTLITTNSLAEESEMVRKWESKKTLQIILLDFSTLPFSYPSTLPSSNPDRSSELAYVIYTSGSTGRPKGTLVSHRNVNNYAAWFKSQFGIGSEDRFAFTSSFCFDMAVTSILVPLISGACIFTVKDKIELEPREYVRYLAHRKISIIKLTPTQFRPLLDFMENEDLRLLRYIILGGEALDVNDVRKYLVIYPHQGIVNEYGPTEATVATVFYVAKGYDMDDINPDEPRPSSLPIGRSIFNTRVYILDKFTGVVPIGVTGELCIGGDSVSRGYLNNPELTADRFLSILPGANKSYSPYISKRIYKTGDLARWLPDGNVEFLGRIDHQVKIRGFRVEPGEIESHLLNHPGIKESVVMMRLDEKGDKYLCAYIVSEKELEISGLREYLAERLPHHMIPSYFVPLDGIPMTPGFKVDRRVLPVPQLKAGAEYVPPTNAKEAKMVKLWSEVLGIKQEIIGIDRDFFDLGGHSLKAMTLISKIHRAFNVKVPLTEVFKTPTIRALAGYIQDSEQEEFISIEPVEEKEYYALSPAQKRLYILQQMETNYLNYNIPEMVILEGKFEKNSLEEAIRQLIDRHENFRTSFQVVARQPVQRIHRHVYFALEYDERGEQETGDLFNTFVRPFNLGQVPLLRVRVVKVGETRNIVMYDMHHIITDGTSMGIFSSELMALYAMKELPPLRLQYKDFSEWQNLQLESETIKKQEKYWLKEFEEDAPVLNLPFDYEPPAIPTSEGDSITFEIDTEETKLLKEMALEEGATLYMVVLAILNVLLSRHCDQEDIIIGTPTAGRRHADLEMIIGFFINMMALRNFPTSQKTFREFLLEVKERTLEAYENQDYQFEELVDKVLKKRNSSRDSLIDVMFVFQNMEVLTDEIPEVIIPGLTLKPYPHELNISPFDLVLNGHETKDQLIFLFQYRTKLFKEETIRMIIHNFKKILSSVLEDRNICLKDIDISHDLLFVESISSHEDEGDFVF